eukprot:175217-Hanusia_phi.AAC.1
MSSVLIDGYQGCDALAELVSLSKKANCVVLEDIPVLPYRRWAESLRTQAPLLLVDTACVLPMKEVGKAYSSASSFRSATMKKRQEYMRRSLSISEPSCKLFVPQGLDPLSLSSSSSSSSNWALDLVRKSSKVDLSVAAVEHSEGGEQVASRRWREYLRTGLSSYARRRERKWEEQREEERREGRRRGGREREEEGGKDRWLEGGKEGEGVNAGRVRDGEGQTGVWRRTRTGRNNALDPGGVSRMSCFLHFGMSPARRLASDACDKKATKFLDVSPETPQ